MGSEAGEHCEAIADTCAGNDTGFAVPAAVEHGKLSSAVTEDQWVRKHQAVSSASNQTSTKYVCQRVSLW